MGIPGFSQLPVEGMGKGFKVEGAGRRPDALLDGCRTALGRVSDAGGPGLSRWLIGIQTV